MSLRRHRTHGLVATLLVLLLWIGPVVGLCFLPWKVLAVLGALCLCSFGIAPAVGFAVWVLLTFFIMEACGFDL